MAVSEARGVALAVALALTACAHRNAVGIQINGCKSHWGADGHHVFRVSLRNNGAKTVRALTLYLGDAMRSGADDAEVTSWAVHFALPFYDTVAIEPGASQFLVVRSASRGGTSQIHSQKEAAAGCVISEASYADGTSWALGFHFARTDSPPYYTLEHSEIAPLR